MHFKLISLHCARAWIQVVPFFSAVFMSLTSNFFINFLSSLLLLVVIVSHLMWLAERTQNSEQFPTRYLDGIDDAIWWELVVYTRPHSAAILNSSTPPLIALSFARVAFGKWALVTITSQRHGLSRRLVRSNQLLRAAPS